MPKFVKFYAGQDPVGHVRLDIIDEISVVKGNNSKWSVTGFASGDRGPYPLSPRYETKRSAELLAHAIVELAQHG